MTRNQLYILLIVTVILFYALFANWYIRAWIATTCDNEGYMRLNGRVYLCDKPD